MNAPDYGFLAALVKRAQARVADGMAPYESRAHAHWVLGPGRAVYHDRLDDLLDAAGM